MARVSKKKEESILNLKDRKQVVVGVCVLTICFLLFVVVKGFCLFYYNPVRMGIVSIVEQKEVANVKKYGNVNVDRLNVTIPEGFNPGVELCYDIKDCKAFFLNGDVDNSWMTIAKSKSSLQSNYELFEHVNNYRDVFNSYNIKNEKDLFEYYFNSNNVVTIFNSLNKIKMNYMSNVYANLVMYGEDVIKLEGDIEGYMYEGPASYFVFLYNGNDTYILSFSDTENSEHFNEDVVMDILETVYFS